MKDADWDAPYNAPVTATVDCPLGVSVAAVTGNVALEDDAGILTEGGTVRAGPSLESATATPPAGAGPVSDMVHVLMEPALRLLAPHDSMAGSTGPRFKVTVVTLARPSVFRLAVMAAPWPAVTAPAVAVKTVDIASAGTDTEAGTVSSGLFALNNTVRGLETLRSSLTVQVLEPPGVKAVGLQLREDTAGATASIREAVSEAPFNVAVRVTLSFWVSVPAVAAKLAEVAVAGTVTVAGMANRALVSDSATTLPPEGAGSFKVTVHSELTAELIVPGLQDSAETSTPGASVKEAVWEPPFKLAMIVTLWVAVTVLAVIVNEADVAPAATDTEAGIVNRALLSDRATVLPLGGAGWFKVTVQVPDALEFIVLELHVREDASMGATKLMSMLWEPPFSVPVMVAHWVVVTAPRFALKVAEVLFAGTVRDAGTVKAELLLESATVVPPCGAA